MQQLMQITINLYNLRNYSNNNYFLHIYHQIKYNIHNALFDAY